MNYLVAILSTVYEDMVEGGEFAFKSKMYLFIEKYSVAMLDPNGYDEIVIHPAPLNLLTFILLPFMIKGTIMKGAAKAFSKFMFWFENLIYLVAFIGYEFILTPLIYFKVMFNVCKMCMINQLFPLLLFWFTCGPLYLVFAVLKDTFYYIKILCDTMEEEDSFNEKAEEYYK